MNAVGMSSAVASTQALPTVTVIVTFYNSIEYVEQALDQIDALDDQDFDLIVTDDASTDGTRQTLEARLKGRHRTILLAFDANQGIATVRNKAVSAASSDFVLFLDGDDAWAPDHLSSLRGLQAKSDADVALVPIVRVASAKQVSGVLLDHLPAGGYEGVSLVRQLLTGNIHGFLMNKLIRRSLLRAYPFPMRRAQEDLAVVSSIILDSSVRLEAGGRASYRYIQRPGSLTNAANRTFRDLDEVSQGIIDRIKDFGLDGQLRLEIPLFLAKWSLAVVNAYTKMPQGNVDAASEERLSSVRAARNRLTWQVVAGAYRQSRRAGLIALAVRAAGPVYPLVYRVYLLSRRVRSARV